jgi:hypothetical protein
VSEEKEHQSQELKADLTHASVQKVLEDSRLHRERMRIHAEQALNAKNGKVSNKNFEESVSLPFVRAEPRREPWIHPTSTTSNAGPGNNFAKGWTGGTSRKAFQTLLEQAFQDGTSFFI